MNKLEKELNNIKSKDELIEWLVNEYECLSNKTYQYQNKLNGAYGDILEEERLNGLEIIKSKANKLMNDKQNYVTLKLISEPGDYDQNLFNLEKDKVFDPKELLDIMNHSDKSRDIKSQYIKGVLVEVKILVREGFEKLMTLNEYEVYSLKDIHTFLTSLQEKIEEEQRKIMIEGLKNVSEIFGHFAKHVNKDIEKIEPNKKGINIKISGKTIDEIIDEQMKELREKINPIIKVMYDFQQKFDKLDQKDKDEILEMLRNKNKSKEDDKHEEDNWRSLKQRVITDYITLRRTEERDDNYDIETILGEIKRLEKTGEDMDWLDDTKEFEKVYNDINKEQETLRQWRIKNKKR